MPLWPGRDLLNHMRCVDNPNVYVSFAIFKMFFGYRSTNPSVMMTTEVALLLTMCSATSSILVPPGRDLSLHSCSMVICQFQGKQPEVDVYLWNKRESPQHNTQKIHHAPRYIKVDVDDMRFILWKITSHFDTINPTTTCWNSKCSSISWWPRL